LDALSEQLTDLLIDDQLPLRNAIGVIEAKVMGTALHQLQGSTDHLILIAWDELKEVVCDTILG
jgi:hypothetical protein